jgi:hypothetical protein
MHDELRKLSWKIAQWIPRRMSRFNPDTKHYERYWNMSPRHQPRFIAPGSIVHSSVFERAAKPDVQYNPSNLPSYAYDETGKRHPPEDGE